MSVWQEWPALRVRVESLALAAEGFVSVLRCKDDDGLGLVDKVIVSTGREVWAALTAFSTRHEAVLPAAARATLSRIANFSFGAYAAPHLNLQLALALRPIISEVDFAFRDHEARARSLVEWAFLHLRRSLVVDRDLRERWRSAFVTSGEVAIEKLGALHLLGHGIYGFKATGAGAATDLILGEPIVADDPDLTVVERVEIRHLPRMPGEATRQPLTALADPSICQQRAPFGSEILLGARIVSVRLSASRGPAIGAWSRRSDRVGRLGGGARVG